MRRRWIMIRILFWVRVGALSNWRAEILGARIRKLSGKVSSTRDLK